jgi:hypothetical protein
MNEVIDSRYSLLPTPAAEDTSWPYASDFVIYALDPQRSGR